MKKIVALVLAMVMVLGLATTAFAAADSSVEGLYAKVTSKDNDAKEVTLEFYKAVAAKDTNKDKVVEEGSVAYYKLPDYSSKTFVEVDTLGEAAAVVYTDKDAENVYMYLGAIDSEKYLPGTVTTDFGTKCGQYDEDDADYNDKKTYYVDVNGQLYVGVDTYTGAQLMVDGKLVAVETVGIDEVEHKPVYTRNDKSEITAIKCSVCGAVATEAPNYASLPENPDLVITGELWYWVEGAAVEGDKVESAETFDAGIAMYVGMSVMAAAGSAVVLKKKD